MTLYCVRLKYRTGVERVEKCDSATGRALVIISTSAFADVLAQWEEAAKDERVAC